MNEPILERLSELSEKQGVVLANQANQQKLLEKHNEMLEKQGEILIRNTAIVDEHQRRSTMLEAELRATKDEVDEISKHVEQVKGIGKLITWLGAIAAIIPLLYGIYQVFKKVGF